MLQDWGLQEFLPLQQMRLVFASLAPLIGSDKRVLSRFSSPSLSYAGCCYSALLKTSHPCVERAMHQDCPVCFEVRTHVPLFLLSSFFFSPAPTEPKHPSHAVSVWVEKWRHCFAMWAYHSQGVFRRDAGALSVTSLPFSFSLSFSTHSTLNLTTLSSEQVRLPDLLEVRVRHVESVGEVRLRDCSHTHATVLWKQDGNSPPTPACICRHSFIHSDPVYVRGCWFCFLIAGMDSVQWLWAQLWGEVSRRGAQMPPLQVIQHAPDERAREIDQPGLRPACNEGNWRCREDAEISFQLLFFIDFICCMLIFCNLIFCYILYCLCKFHNLFLSRNEM